MKLLRFFISKAFWINLPLAIGFVALALWGTMNWLDSFTRHGESLTVPSLQGMSIPEVEDLLKSKNLRFEVSDSVYYSDKPKATVVDQNPAPEAKVKEGRKIYLTLNTINPPLIKMPNLVDVSYRQATAMIESYGFRLGELIYKPDLAKNVVLDQKINGRSIDPDTEVYKGSVVDLVIGDGLSDTEVPIPNLYGRYYDEALAVLKHSSLNIGAVSYDEGVDSVNATVYRQIPPYSADGTIRQGQIVDLFFR